MDRNLLLLCYYFPPAALALAQRVAKLCKYLPNETNWIPHVICGELSLDLVGLDNSLLSEIPEIIGVERVGSYLSSNLAFTLRAWHLEKPMRLWRKLAVEPDAFGDWIAAAVDVAEKRFSAGKGIKVILASGPPNSVYIAGAHLSKRWHVPLVMDMRDPWSQLWGKRRWFSFWDNRQKEYMEQCYGQASAIITNTPGNKGDLIRHFPQYSGKIEMIPNGFDPDDLDQEQGPHLYGQGESDGVMHLLYLGGIRGKGFEEPFFRVLAEHLIGHPEERNRLKVHFVGGTPPQIKALAQPFGLQDICLAHGIVPANEVGRPLAEADIYVLLLPLGNYDGCVPAKLYYYLAGGKSIFAMVPEGSAKTMLSGLGELATIVGYNDVASGKVALGTVITQARQFKKRRSGNSFPASALPYDRRNIARQVGAVLGKVVAEYSK